MEETNIKAVSKVPLTMILATATIKNAPTHIDNKSLCKLPGLSHFKTEAIVTIWP